MRRWLWAVVLASCAPPADEFAGEERPGGATTVANASREAFGFPAANVTGPRVDRFFVGNAFFKTNWVAAPASTEGRDGLGPLFNAPSCSACHLRDGRGAPTGAALLFRISTAEGAPHPAYGDQVQPFGVLGVKGEPSPRVAYEEVPGAYGDGAPYSLRRPAYELEGLRISPRIAPSVFGVGLLETIPEARILGLAKRNGGRPNAVPHVRAGGTSIGRFGWKANQPSVEQQIAAAFLGDIGITSPLFPEPGRPPEINEEKLEAVTFYMKMLAVPARRRPRDPEVRRGRSLFAAAGCASCHAPRHVTGDDPRFPELSRQTIFPYTDLLLHDMGPGLADGRPDHRASGSEWRTPPLWGLGLVETVNGHTFLLHDGRARNAAEAVLWHGGEAEGARESFRKMKAADRAALLAFVNDL